MSNELTAGRELDALIARTFFAPNAMWDQPAWVQGYLHGMKGEGGPCPHYSTSIEAVWQVVEKLIKDGFLVMLDGDDAGWDCRITKRGLMPVEASESTTPLAICRAALAAIESEAAR